MQCINMHYTIYKSYNEKLIKYAKKLSILLKNEDNHIILHYSKL